MKLTEEIKNLLIKIAGDAARDEIFLEDRRLASEARGALTNGSIDEASMLLDVYQTDRCNLYSASSKASRTKRIAAEKTTRVVNCLEPVTDTPPTRVHTGHIPIDAPGLVGYQWHHFIPVWGWVASKVDQDIDLERRSRMADEQNARNKAEYEAHCRERFQHQIAAVIDIPPAALRLGVAKAPLSALHLQHRLVELPRRESLPMPCVSSESVQFLTGSFVHPRKTDLVALHKIGTPSGFIEAHIYSSASGWRERIGHVVTGLRCHDAKFLLGYYRREVSHAGEGGPVPLCL
jgi:hypothetical protein